jgi:hypothetical protein
MTPHPVAENTARLERLDAWTTIQSDNVRSINGDTIAIDGGSLTRGYPALLTGPKRAS